MMTPNINLHRDSELPNILQNNKMQISIIYYFLLAIDFFKFQIALIMQYECIDGAIKLKQSLIDTSIHAESSWS